MPLLQSHRRPSPYLFLPSPQGNASLRSRSGVAVHGGFRSGAGHNHGGKGRRGFSDAYGGVGEGEDDGHVGSHSKAGAAAALASQWCGVADHYPPLLPNSSLNPSLDMCRSDEEEKRKDVEGD
ncbi:hypothetical protein ACQJBY_005482 [Aegilops geniculata]